MGTNWQSLYIFVSMERLQSLSPKQYISRYRQALVGLEDRWEPRWAQALGLLTGSEEWIFLGTGKSGYIARKLAATARSLGKKAVFMLPSEAFHGDLGYFSPGCLAIFISKSGNSDEQIKLSTWLKINKLPSIGLLGNTEGILASAMSVNLDCSVSTEADSLNLAPSCSTVVAMVAGESLMFSWADATGFNYSNFSAHHPAGQLGKNWSLRVEQVMHPLESVARIKPEQSMREVLIAMTEKPLGLACVEDQGKLLGIITEGDIRRALVNGTSMETCLAKSLMNPNPTTCFPSHFLGEAIHLMESEVQKRSALPVVDAHQALLGVIRIHDAY